MKTLSIKESTKVFYIACVKGLLKDGYSYPYIVASIDGFLQLYLNKAVPEQTAKLTRVEIIKGIGLAIAWAEKDQRSTKTELVETVNDLHMIRTTLRDCFIERIKVALVTDGEVLVIKRSKM